MDQGQKSAVRFSVWAIVGLLVVMVAWSCVSTWGSHDRVFAVLDMSEAGMEAELRKVTSKELQWMQQEFERMRDKATFDSVRKRAGMAALIAKEILLLRSMGRLSEP
jgi:hypothetical protein